MSRRTAVLCIALLMLAAQAFEAVLDDRALQAAIASLGLGIGVALLALPRHDDEGEA